MYLDLTRSRQRAPALPLFIHTMESSVGSPGPTRPNASQGNMLATTPTPHHTHVPPYSWYDWVSPPTPKLTCLHLNLNNTYVVGLQGTEQVFPVCSGELVMVVHIPIVGACEDTKEDASACVGTRMALTVQEHGVWIWPLVGAVKAFLQS